MPDTDIATTINQRLNADHISIARNTSLDIVHTSRGETADEEESEAEDSQPPPPSAASPLQQASPFNSAMMQATSGGAYKVGKKLTRSRSGGGRSDAGSTVSYDGAY